MVWRTLTLALCLVCLGQAAAQSHGPRSWFGGWWKTCPSIGCCPDDYDRKPCPTLIPLPPCNGPDNYCRKIMPWLSDIPHCGSPDDYCRKSIPSLLCPPFSPHLQCGPVGSCMPGKRP